MISYDRPRTNADAGIRADLIDDNCLQVHYPQSKAMVLDGRRVKSYMRFTIPEVHEHLIATIRSA